MYVYRLIHILGIIVLYFFLQCPEKIETLSDKNVIDISCRADGKHFLALTSEGEVYSWGMGDGGRLGHGDTKSRSEPHLIQALASHRVIRISSGSSYR